MNKYYVYTTALLIIYSIILTFVYYAQIHEHYYYMGFDFEFSLPRVIFSLLLICGLSTVVAGTPSAQTFFALLIMYGYVIPALILYSFGNFSNYYVTIAVLAVFVLIVISMIKTPRLSYGPLSKRDYLILSGASVALALAGLVLSGAWRNFSLDIYSVYEFRSVAETEMPSIFGYIVSPVSKVIVPLGVVLSLHFKSRFLAAVFVGLSLVFFGMTHHKSVFAVSVLAWALYEIINRKGAAAALHYFFFGIAGTAAFEALYWRLVAPFGQAGVFNGVIVRRVLFVPPRNDSLYIEFFANNPLVFWANSKITFGLLDNPYALSPAALIAHYSGRTGGWQNSGFIANGFAHASLFGVLLYAVVIGLIISQIDAHSKQVGRPLALSASAIAVNTAITSSDLLTTLLTHGLLLLLILLAGIPKAAPD